MMSDKTKIWLKIITVAILIPLLFLWAKSINERNQREIKFKTRKAVGYGWRAKQVRVSYIHTQAWDAQPASERDINEVMLWIQLESPYEEEMKAIIIATTNSRQLDRYKRIKPGDTLCFSADGQSDRLEGPNEEFEKLRLVRIFHPDPEHNPRDRPTPQGGVLYR